MALTEDQFFEQYWPSTPQYQDYLDYVELSKRPVGKGVQKISQEDIARVEETMRRVARTDPRFGFPTAWQIYSLEQQNIAEQKQQQEIQNIYSQILTETQKQSDVLRKQSEAALSQQRALTQQEKITAATTQQAPTTTVTQKRRTSVGQPGVARTRLSTGTTVGGFSGTSPGRINPTGLNI